MNKLITAVFGLVALGLVSRAGAVTLSLVPASQFAQTGDPVSVDLVIDGLGDFAPASLGDFDVDVGYDPAALTFQNYSLGPFLGDVGLGEAIDFSLGDLGGIVNLAEVSLLEPDAASCGFCVPPFLDDIQPASFTLATLEFTVNLLAPGASTIVSISNVYVLGDGFGDPLPLDGTSDAEIVAPIPVPAAVWLFCSGLVGLAGLARRRPAKALR